MDRRGGGVPVKEHQRLDQVSGARRLVEEGRHSEAIAILKPWVEDNPQDARAWSLIAAAYFEGERWGPARAAAEEAVNLRPDDAREWCNLGVILRKTGDYTGAAAAQQHALRLEPANQRAKLELEKANKAQQEALPPPPATPYRRPPWKRATVVVSSSLVLIGMTGALVLQTLWKPAVSPDVPTEQRVGVALDVNGRSAATSGQSEATDSSVTGSEDPPAPEETTVSNSSIAHTGTAPLEQRPTRQQMLQEGRLLYQQQEYGKAYELFIAAAHEGSNDGQRWADACLRRMDEDDVRQANAAQVIREQAQAAAEARRAANLPKLDPPPEVVAEAKQMARNLVSSHITVSLPDGGRAERFASMDVVALSAQETLYEGSVPVWSGTLLVTGIVQVPSVVGGGRVYKDYDYSVRITKPHGQAAGHESMVARLAYLELR